VPRTSSASPPRCRQCGAPLVGEKKRRRICPRCHPGNVEAGPQLELSLTARELAPTAPPKAPVLDAIAPPPPPKPVVEAKREKLPEASFLPLQPVWWEGRGVRLMMGSLIVLGGLSWGGYQMWPRGPVEREIIQALDALPHFVERTGAVNPFDGLTVGGESTPVLVDLSGDGLPDLVSGSRGGEIRVFRNLGTRTRPRFSVAPEAVRGLVPTDTANTPAFADLRGVGVPDALNAGTNAALTFFRNRGTPARPDFVLLAPEDDPFAGASARQSFDWRPVFADIDHDGDADLFLGTRDGTVLFLENHGTPRKPQFQGAARVAPFGLRGLGEVVSLSRGDLDRDGDLDAVAGNAAGDVLFLYNRGNASRPKFGVAPPGTLGLGPAGSDATVALADLDADGDLDCVVGGADGRFRYFENLSTSPKPRPPAPAK
jgi:hypothetical protein